MEYLVVGIVIWWLLWWITDERPIHKPPATKKVMVPRTILSPEDEQIPAPVTPSAVELTPPASNPCPPVICTDGDPQCKK
jgi:hypothetical protein